VRPPFRAKPAQYRAVRRLKRSSEAFDADLYLERYPDVASAGIDPVLHYVEFGARQLRSPGAGATAVLGENAMKRDWDARARADAMHFVLSDRHDWDEQAFADSGRGSVDAAITADLEWICRGRDPAEMRMLEIGCGVGRMTGPLAELFGEVHGVDVSGEMVSRGRDRLSGRENVFLHETNGWDLENFEDEFFDFAFSFIVFQHVPEKGIVASNLREVHRTLKPGGAFKFQVKDTDLERQPDTWVGISFDGEELRRLASEIGFTVERSEGEGTQYLWQSWLRN
jgi:SAM-dependent methyltransferase